jgi:FkbM family methyltransferase
LSEVKDNAGLNGFQCVHPVGVALGSVAENMRLAGAAEGIDGTHRVVRIDALESGPGFDVPVVRGDDWAASNPQLKPTVVKLDVEGAELDVLTGLSGVLKTAACRAVVAEVHFGILHATGRDDVPAKIVKLLKTSGFTRIDWLDASHLSATKS